MGVGKTTIGRFMASALDRDFIDVDQEIEKQNNMPITEIFKMMGENRFRQMEKEIILDLCHNCRSKIISLGGGAFLQEEIRNACLATSTVVYFDLSWESWKERLYIIKSDRPLLNNKTLEEIEELFHSRRKVYEMSHLKVSIDNLNPEQAADHVIHLLKLI